MLVQIAEHVGRGIRDAEAVDTHCIRDVDKSTPVSVVGRLYMQLFSLEGVHEMNDGIEGCRDRSSACRWLKDSVRKEAMSNIAVLVCCLLECLRPLSHCYVFRGWPRVVGNQIEWITAEETRIEHCELPVRLWELTDQIPFNTKQTKFFGFVEELRNRDDFNTVDRVAHPNAEDRVVAIERFDEPLSYGHSINNLSYGHLQSPMPVSVMLASAECSSATKLFSG